MPHDYKLTPAAKNDVKAIWQYTLEKWGERQAEKYIAQLTEKFKDLAETPNLGRARPDIHNSYRSLVVNKHIIFYRVANKLIEIIGIPHASMDVETHLSSQLEN